MSQSAPTIGANKSGLAYRQEDNDGKTALLTHHKGATAPSYAEAGTIWIDDAATPWLLKLHDGSDWITLGAVHAGNNTFLPYVGTAGMKTLPFASDTGSANAYTIAPTPAITAYSEGQMVILKPLHTNTSAATLSINGLTATAIKTPDGADVEENDLIAGQVYILIYDGTHFIVTNIQSVPTVSPETMPNGSIVNSVYAAYTESTFLYTNIPEDDTIPQKTEGTEFLSASITPQSVTNKLRITVQGMGDNNSSGGIIVAVFQDDITDAIAAKVTSTETTTGLKNFFFVHEYCPATTSSVTFKLRAGAASSYIRLNGPVTGRALGGVMSTTITIEEIKSS